MPAPVFVIAFANNAAEQDRHLPALDAEFARLQSVLGDGRADRRWELVSSPKTSIKSFLDLLQDDAYQRRIALLHFAGHANGEALLLEADDGTAEVATAAGLAEFLAQHEGLGFLFLNACSTVGQVQALLAAGVPAIVATEHDINDAVAAEFSSRFYQEFVNGQTLRKAFDAAAAAVKTNLTLKTAAQSRAIAGVGRKRDPDDWPWKLHVREGNATADQWSLGLALDDPLWGVPDPEPRPLPDAPFRHLLPFGAAHAAIFFGRRRETRAVYDAIERGDARRVVLLHGVSGAGKSSLLDAGLLPRLERTRSVRYARRRADVSLLGNLCVMLGVAPALANDGAGCAPALAAAWHAGETADRPLTLILDQVEEAISDPTRNGKRELADLIATLKYVFDQASAPRGSIVLGFRKEWLADVQSQLDLNRLASTAIFLDRLDERGISEAIEGVWRDTTLRAHYRLEIPSEESGLAAEIAGDLVTDAASAIAPTLQVLLTKMWERSRAAAGSHVFTRALYRTMVKEGALLSDFVDQQLAMLRQSLPTAEESGLALDVLAFHATDLGDATRVRTAGEREARYPAVLRDDVMRIVSLSVAGRLLSSTDNVQAAGDTGRVGATRLGHDTLARYIRTLATNSVKPVQRAQRVLAERAAEWNAGGARRVLSAPDLALVERGLPQMPALSDTERALIEASRADVQHTNAMRRRVRMGFAGAAVALAAVGTVAWIQGARAKAEAHRATIQAMISAATSSVDPLEAVLMLRSLERETEEPVGAVQAALTALSRPVPATVLTGHAGLVTAAAFSPDGEWILTASSDSTARLWPRDGSSPPRILRGHTNWVTAAAFSPDGSQVLTASTDSTIRIWGRNDSTAPRVLQHVGPVVTASYCPDGRTIVSAADTTVYLWRVNERTSPRRLFGHSGSVSAVVCSPDSKHVVSVSDDYTARVWRTDGAGAPVVLRGHIGVVLAAAFSADGAHVVTGSDDQSALIWRTDGRGEPVNIETGAGAVTTVAFSPNGKFVALGTSGGEAQIWGVNARGGPITLRGHNGQLMSLAYDRDGEHLLTASMDGTSREWNADGFGSPHVFGGHTGIVATARFSPDQRWLLTAGNDGTVRVWPRSLPEVAERLRSPSGPVQWGAFSADGSRIVAGSDSTVDVWSDGGHGAHITLRGHHGRVSSARFSGDGSRIVTASHDETARVWRADGTDTAALAVFDAQAGQVGSAVFSADGTRVLTTHEDNNARIWNSTGGNPLLTLEGHEAAVLSGAFSPDGRHIATAAEDLTARIWNADGRGTPTILRGHTGAVTHVSYSRDGAWLVTASDDATARVWPASGQSPAMILRGHTGGLNDAEFSADGQLVVTAAADRTARITRRDGSGVAVILRGHTAAVTSASFSPDDRHVLTTSVDGTVRIWPITWPELLDRLQTVTSACLSADQRMRLLGESVRQANDEARICTQRPVSRRP
jgi:WD40 repeat protein